MTRSSGGRGPGAPPPPPIGAWGGLLPWLPGGVSQGLCPRLQCPWPRPLPTQLGRQLSGWSWPSSAGVQAALFLATFGSIFLSLKWAKPRWEVGLAPTSPRQLVPTCALRGVPSPAPEACGWPRSLAGLRLLPLEAWGACVGHLPPPPPLPGDSHVLCVFVSRQEEEGPGREEAGGRRSQPGEARPRGVSELGL